jgi:hypothetical protein
VRDPGFAFHRCLRNFNWFVEAVLYMTKDVRVRPVTSYDLRPIVIIGARTNADDWRLLTPMHMHPDEIAVNSLPSEPVQ